MHELGILTQALKRVQRAADEKGISKVKYITLEVGDSSGYVCAYFMKLHPAARDMFPALRSSELHLVTVPGRTLRIKDMAY